MTAMSHLSWLSIARLGLVQTCLGAIVVLTTSTLNRLMVVELALPAVLPGFLVALHYGVQITRPGWGHRSDVSGNRTRWIVGGMAILGAGALLAAAVLWLAAFVNFSALVASGNLARADRTDRAHLCHLPPTAAGARPPAGRA